MELPRINVTKTFLPPQDEYEAYLGRIWESGWLTNQGPLTKEFERRAGEYLEVSNFHYVSNGTIALQIALNALGIAEGEIITTPFSYVATTSAILWERCEPVYVDIDPETLCIDPDKIEAAITDRTRAILAVHVFGYPCDVEKIETLAKKHGLKVIYDGAHAFGARYNDKPLLSYGDISTCSFHATKLFHTVEGGCVIAQEEAVSAKLELAKRFGHEGDEHYSLGINAKASEFHAAMGLANFPYIHDILDARRKLHVMYEELLDGSKIERPVSRNRDGHNHAYYPIILKDEKHLHSVVAALNKKNVFPRRYFFPSLNRLPYVERSQDCPVSEDISRRILCLPFYPGLVEDDVRRIAEAVNGAA